MTPGRLATTALLLGLCSPVGAAPGIEAVTSVSPVVIGQQDRITIEVKGLDGSGEPMCDANVGAVERIEDGASVRIHYRLPSGRFPQMLCLALWRQSGADAEVSTVRIPLLARTSIPVRTRPRSMVRITVGRREFGPVNSGARGRTRIKVLVPPGVSKASVEVTDRADLKTSKTIKINRQPFNQLAVAINHDAGPGKKHRLRVSAAVAEPTLWREAPVLQIGGEQIPMERQPQGVWSGVWAPERRPPPGRIPIKIWLAKHERSIRHAEINLGAAKLTVHLRRVRSRAVASSESQLRAHLGLTAGMLHNLGAVVSPRFGLNVGLDYPLPVGRIGLTLFAAVSWASQEIAAAGGLDTGESSVLMIPLGGGVTYRLPLTYLTPYVMLGCMAQVIRTSNTASYTNEVIKHDVAFGVLGHVGVDRRFGPGRILLQVGYQWSELYNQDIRISAGGVVLEGGYQLEL